MTAERAGHVDTGIASPVARLEWMTAAACLGCDPELWHPAKGGTSVDARRICAGCVVRAECATYALTTDEPLTGVWGGLTGKDRAKLRGTSGYLSENYRTLEQPRPWLCPDCGRTGLHNLNSHRAKVHGWRRTA